MKGTKKTYDQMNRRGYSNIEVFVDDFVLNYEDLKLNLISLSFLALLSSDLFF